MKRLLFILVVFIACVFVSACSVTRTIKTQADCVKGGDTISSITTKTIESYDATKQGL